MIFLKFEHTGKTSLQSARSECFQTQFLLSFSRKVLCMAVVRAALYCIDFSFSQEESRWKSFFQSKPILRLKNIADKENISALAFALGNSEQIEAICKKFCNGFFATLQ